MIYIIALLIAVAIIGTAAHSKWNKSPDKHTFLKYPGSGSRYTPAEDKLILSKCHSDDYLSGLFRRSKASIYVRRYSLKSK